MHPLIHNNLFVKNTHYSTGFFGSARVRIGPQQSAEKGPALVRAGPVRSAFETLPLGPARARSARAGKSKNAKFFYSYILTFVIIGLYGISGCDVTLHGCTESILNQLLTTLWLILSMINLFSTFAHR